MSVNNVSTKAGVAGSSQVSAQKAAALESISSLQLGKVSVQDSLQMAIPVGAEGSLFAQQMNNFKDFFSKLPLDQFFSANQQTGMFGNASFKKIAAFAQPESPAIAMAYQKRYEGMQFSAGSMSSMRGGSANAQFGDTLLKSLANMPDQAQIQSLMAGATGGVGLSSLAGNAESFAVMLQKQKQMEAIQSVTVMMSKIMSWGHSLASSIINNLK